jgi:hypothetical protein
MEESLMTGLCDNVKLFEQLGVRSYFLLVCNIWYELPLTGGPNRYGFDFKKRSFTWYNDGNMTVNTSTCPLSRQGIAKLLSAKELPDDEDDKSPTLFQFRKNCVYISSFRVSQHNMFESV